MAEANGSHLKRDYTQPSVAIVRIDFEHARNQWAQNVGRDAPVGKEQVVPLLLHDPSTAGKRPWAMRGLCECRMHGPLDARFDGEC
jgi:hypothetical protein